MPIPIHAILDHLRLESPAPTLPFLDRLLGAWAARIPWESASRIARHRRGCAIPADCARPPEAFFDDALRLGTGGTCFESNLALKTLLDAIGFSGDLIFCDMLEAEGWQIDPHSAVIVQLDGARYLADVGYPVPAALRLDSSATTAAETPVYHYRAIPVAPDRWEVRWISGAHSGLGFLAKGVPIDREAFWARLVRDHEPGGFFLDEVIIHRDEGDHRWRYSEGKGLVRRVFGLEEPVLLTAAEQADLPGTLARIFGLDRALLAAALGHTESGRPSDG